MFTSFPVTIFSPTAAASYDTSPDAKYGLTSAGGWNNPTHCNHSGQFASADSQLGTLAVSNFGFNIDPAATILGMQATWLLYTDLGIGSVQSITISVNGSDATSNSYAPVGALATVATAYTVGTGTTDLWNYTSGSTITGSYINQSNFGSNIFVIGYGDGETNIYAGYCLLTIYF